MQLTVLKKTAISAQVKEESYLSKMTPNSERWSSKLI